MLPGVDFSEMLLLAVLAMVLLGPRELPLMMRKFGRFTGKMRALAFEFRQGFDELGRQAELDELRKEVTALKKSTGVEDLQREFEEDQRNMEKDIASAMAPVAVKPPGEPAAISDSGEAAPDAEPSGATPAESAAGSAYDAGEDFEIDAGHKPPPVKQDAGT